MLVALLVRSCASAIAVPPTARITVDAAAYGRAKRRAVSESWSHKLEVEDFLTRADFLARARVASDPPASVQPGYIGIFHFTIERAARCVSFFLSMEKTSRKEH